MEKLVNGERIILGKLKFYPRSKTYDVVWYDSVSKKDRYEHIEEASLLLFINLQDLNRREYYNNVDILPALRVLEEQENRIILMYLEYLYIQK